MSVVGEISERKERPAYVRFERRAVEDKVASRKQGRYVAKDVDMAFVTAPYSKDIFIKEVDSWLRDMEVQVKGGRIPAEWLEKYKQDYARWEEGQEIPLDGTAIKGWGVISPAQQDTLIKLHILTVEDLAGINEDAIRAIGMGAVDLKHKAQAWLSQLQDKGKLTQEMAALQKENAVLQGSVESLERQVNELKALVKAQTRVGGVSTPEPSSEITADDLLEQGGEAPPPPPMATPRRRGRPPKEA